MEVPTSGKRRFRSSRGRRAVLQRVAAYGLIVLVILGIGGGTYLGYERVRASATNLQDQITAKLVRAQQDLETAKSTLEQANTKHDATLASQAATQFQTASDEFAAGAKLADRSQLLRYVELAPSVGEQVHAKHVAVDLLSDMGVQLSGAGLHLAQLDVTLIQPKAESSAGKTFLTVVNQTTQRLNCVLAYLIQAQSDASRVNVDLLPAGQQGTLIKARSSIDAGIQALYEFQRLVPVLVDILGGNGPRTYLVEQLNPAELRAGGGFIGSYSLIKANQGTISVVRSGDAYDLADPRPRPGQPGFIPEPTPLREIIPATSWSFVDSNIYADFPSNAKAAMNFAAPRIGKLDGVIAFDYYTVARMLALTGPIAVPGYGVTLTSSNLVPTLIKLDVSGAIVRKTILAALAGPLMNKVSSIPADRWTQLITTMNGLADQRHIQAYFTNAGVEAEINRVGWSGVLNPAQSSEWFMETEDNYYGTKDNYFLARHFVLNITRIANILHQSLQVGLTNRTVCGSYGRTEYLAIIRLFASGGMSGASSDLRKPIYADPPPPSGVGMIDGWVSAQCGGGKAAPVLQYNSPWAPDSAGTETIYWQKQPGTNGDTLTVIWSDGSGHTAQTTGDLNQDQVIHLADGLVTLTAGSPGQAQLPTLSLG